MTTSPQSHARFKWARELIVPAIMIFVIATYAYDSMHLSSVALIFPGALILVIVASLLWPVAASFAHSTSSGASGEAAPEPILSIRPWSLIALPALLFAIFEYLGALPALIALIFGAQLIFSAKAIFKNFLIAALVSIPTYILFKYFLYVRFPLGILGIG